MSYCLDKKNVEGDTPNNTSPECRIFLFCHAENHMRIPSHFNKIDIQNRTPKFKKRTLRTFYEHSIFILFFCLSAS